jgi:hypothetical protein
MCRSLLPVVARGACRPAVPGGAVLQRAADHGGWRLAAGRSCRARTRARPIGSTFLNAVLAFSAANVWPAGTFEGPGGERTLIMYSCRQASTVASLMASFAERAFQPWNHACARLTLIGLCAAGAAADGL